MEIGRWLITGGCGFIGTNLIARVLRERPGSSIRVLDNLSVGSREDLDAVSGGASVELMVGDIRDPDACARAAEGVDVIVHLAANTGVEPSVRDPMLDMESNVIGTFNMLEAARRAGTGKFVFASSCAPIGEVEPPINEQKPPRPISPYGASKLAGEGYCSAYYRTFGVNTTALRFGNVYGPGSKRKSSVVAKFFRKAFEGEPLEIYGDGNQTRDFIYIDDLTQAIMLSVGSDVGGEVFQIATYRETTVNEITQKIKELLKKELGLDVEVVHKDPRTGDMRRNYSDISKAKEVLGFEPRFDIDRGLEATLRYFMKRRAC